jgi:hypothetical protein
MEAQRGDAGIRPDELAELRAELAVWRRAQSASEPSPDRARAGRGVDLDLSALRDSRPLRAAPPTSEEYVAALRSALLDLRAVETAPAH